MHAMNNNCTCEKGVADRGAPVAEALRQIKMMQGVSAEKAVAVAAEVEVVVAIAVAVAVAAEVVIDVEVAVEVAVAVAVAVTVTVTGAKTAGIIQAVVTALEAAHVPRMHLDTVQRLIPFPPFHLTIHPVFLIEIKTC